MKSQRKYGGPDENRTHRTDIANVCRLLGTCQPIFVMLYYHKLYYTTSLKRNMAADFEPALT